MDIIIGAAPQCRERTLTVMLPSSKSLSARALLIARLAGCADLVTGAAVCDDTAALERALNASHGTVDVGAAGTAMRFLTAHFAAMPGADVFLDGSPRMRQRPVAPLVDALRQAGATIDYTGTQGCPPLKIAGRRLEPFDVTMRGDVSSQFVSAMMMIAPSCGGGVIRLSSQLTSRPYVEMTAGVMSHFGARVTVGTDAITVGATPYRPAAISIEADWSAASYWYALTAVTPGLTVRLPRLTLESMQGDCRIAAIMRQLGVATSDDNGTLTLSRQAPPLRCACPHAFYADMADVPDLAQTVVVTLCLLERAFRITGLHTLRVKETDRIAAMRDEMARFGYDLQTGDDHIAWHGQRCTPDDKPCVDTHDDHRMAMAMAIAAMARGGATIRHAEVVSKSYPSFWQDLDQIATLQTI